MFNIYELKFRISALSVNPLLNRYSAWGRRRGGVRANPAVGWTSGAGFSAVARAVAARNIGKSERLRIGAECMTFNRIKRKSTAVFVALNCFLDFLHKIIIIKI